MAVPTICWDDKESFIECQQIQKHFSDSAKTYAQGAQLQHIVGKQLLSLVNLDLESVKRGQLTTTKQNQYSVDLGCGPGLFTQSLQDKFDSVIALDLSYEMLKHNTNANNKLQANSHNLPFKKNSIDVFYSSLMIQWCDFEQVLEQIHTALKPGGCAYIATLVKGTLSELEHAWQSVDNDQHIHDYVTAKQIHNYVNKLSWSSATFKSEKETFWFDSVRALAKELKFLGANFVQRRKNKGLVTKTTWQSMEQSYSDAFYCGVKQAIPASYQVLYVVLKK